MKCEITITPPASAEAIMQKDAALLATLQKTSHPTLHLYDWEKKAVTFGHFIDPQQFLNLDAAAALELDLAKRPTGGGIIFHLTDLAFSFLLPATHRAFSLNPLDNYAFVNKRTARAIERFLGKEQEKATLLPSEPIPLDEASKHFCMAKPTKYDVMLGSKKVGGAAQRKTRFGYLHQGSISLGLLPPSFLEEILLPGSMVAKAMAQNTFAPLGAHFTKKTLAEARLVLRHYLIESFTS